MNADTLEALADLLRKIDEASAGWLMDGTVDVRDDEYFLGTLRFNDDTESTFEAA